VVNCYRSQAELRTRWSVPNNVNHLSPHTASCFRSQEMLESKMPSSKGRV
jgi:hypothetical protein